MKRLFAVIGTLLAAGSLFVLSFAGGVSAVETSGTLGICVNNVTGNVVARATCGVNETRYLVEAEEVVTPAPPRPTPTEVAPSR